MELLQPLISAVQQLGMLGYWLVFFVSFFEAFLFVGSVIPGASLIIFAGFFSIQGYLDIGDLIIFAALGVALGNGINYYLGTKGTHFFRNERTLLELNRFERGERFFKRYGGKSILFAQFSSPIRGIVPFVAGLMKTDVRIFLVWNTFGAIAWALAYLLAGYFFGVAIQVLEVWSTRVSLFFLLLCAVIVVLWFFIKRITPFFSFLFSITRSVIEGIIQNPEIRRFAARHPLVAHFVRRRFDRKHFSGLPLTLLGVAFMYILSLLFGVTQSILGSSAVILADTRVAHLIFAFRSTEFVAVFTWITLLGKWEVVVSAAAMLSAVLWLREKHKYIIPLWVTLAGTEAFVSFGKYIFHRARPEIAVYLENSYSFPSGHSAIAVAFYGFLAYILFCETKKWRYKINGAFLILLAIVLIGFSRVYLGVHFLSDVWGGYLLGALWLLVGMAIVEWLNHHRRFSAITSTHRARLAVTALIAAELVFFVGFGLYYDPPRIQWHAEPVITKTADVFGMFQNNTLPHFTEMLDGQAQEPLSFIIIAKNDVEFADVMRKAGWLRADDPSIASVLRIAQAAFANESYATAPMTPSFWNTKVHDIGFEKPTNANNVRARHHARFWRADLVTEDNEQVYVGTASEDVGIKWFVTHQIRPDIDTERDLLLADLSATGDVMRTQTEQFVPPTLGTNFSGDQFFTDGKIYLLFLQ